MDGPHRILGVYIFIYTYLYKTNKLTDQFQIHNNYINNLSFKFTLILQALPDDCLPVDITEPGKLDEIFDRMDANSDGRVSFDEFKTAMQRDSSLQDVVLSSLRPN